MTQMSKWLLTAVAALTCLGAVNVWTTEDLKEFRVNWQDYPHHRLNQSTGYTAPPVRSDDGGSSWGDDYFRNDLRVGDEILLVENAVPEFGSYGEDFMVDMKVTALKDAAEIFVATSVPDGATYVKSEPSGQLMGDQVVWKFDKMHEGEIKNLKAWFRPSGEGDYASCTKAHALPLACVITKIRTPHLIISKEGPETAGVGEMVPYTIIVKNDGSAPAEDVVVTDFVPRGMLFDGSGEKVINELGMLEPGESKTIRIDLEATQRGYFCNQTQVTASNANTASAEACTKVLMEGVQITKSGPSLTYIGKSATYNIRVTNTGDTNLTDLEIRDDIDGSTRVVSGDGASWHLDSLAPGESRSLSITLDSDSAGTFCNEVTVNTNQGVSDSAEACTEWRGHPAILMELIDTNDPLTVGETTTYRVRVTNQGSAEDTKVGVKLVFPSQIQPFAANGATDGRISGGTVTFQPYEVLRAGQTIEFEVDAKAAGKGDSRIRLELDSDLLQRPVVEEESTHVY